MFGVPPLGGVRFSERVRLKAVLQTTEICMPLDRDTADLDLDVRGLAVAFHPLAMNSLRHWIRLLRLHGPIDRDKRLSASLITLAGAFWTPLRALESALFDRRVAGTEIANPVFIIGHWRTGTTFLHYLLSQDPAFGFVPLFQTLAPASFLLGRRSIKPLMKRFVPETRPMDNMDLGLDLPQEEEYALCNLCPYSFYAGWYFPRDMRLLFERYGLFEGVEDHVVEEWKEIYLGVLKKATLHAEGRPLLLKNPVNTARIRWLLELFPNARFIHLCRNPYAVYKSTQLLHRTAINWVGLQRISDEEIAANILLFYRQLVQRYFDHKDLIPNGQLVEMRYEDLVQRPVAELERAYRELSLPGWEAARPRFEAYAARQQAYIANRHSLSPEDSARVLREWGFAFERWDYDPASL